MPLRKIRKEDVDLAKRREGAGPYLEKLRQQLENPSIDENTRNSILQRMREIADELRG